MIIFIIAVSTIVIVALQFKPIRQTTLAIVTSPSYINKNGNTIIDRVKTPEGYKRVAYDSVSFQNYIRNQKLQKYGAKVINYDGTPYFYQLGHVGVLDIDVPNNGLQQCADALIRLRSEYLWSTNEKGEIGFQFTSGHYCSWKKYAEGYRPKINGNKVTFHKTARVDNSKTNFYKYLNLIYTYSGTMSLNNELNEVNSINDLKIGDMLVVGGFPGHIVMIADIVQNNQGERLFLLLQGNTPAQSIHLLRNLDDTTISPWYKLQLNSEISVPGFTFTKSKFVRFK
ncbi:DUF4846 domain-containing protein [Winogradskyella sp.]|uniref:DUF4846 domain-containing protein n=1 Tax=Winogradskyella sp. TaxID=1883156 RepID=UPI0025EFA0D3|nr:DUF4846 domain-containing protein [Winogradskyella sp.]